MKILFSKYHANGNDFILVMDKNFTKNLRETKIISRLCRRHTGIGADGFFIISASNIYDFFLDYYNADGTWETLCANGSRCAAKFMYNSGNVGRKLKFETGAGVHASEIMPKGQVLMSMETPDYKSGSLSVEGVVGYFVDSGARHFVCHSKILDDEYILDKGKKIRFASEFQPRGINVNFYRLNNNNNLEIKTYEKGVEKIMLSCASGSTAVVYHLSQLNLVSSPVTTHSAGGNLTFTFDEKWMDPWVEGPAEYLFSGEFDLAVLK